MTMHARLAFRTLALLTLAWMSAGCHTFISDTRVVWSTPTRHLEVTLRGDVELGLEDEPIHYLSPGGRLRIDDRSSRHRRLVALGRADGSIELQYWLDGQRSEIDSEARLWVQSVVERVIRKTPIGARTRARRILEQEGPSGLLQEIESGGISAAAIYLQELILDDQASSSQIGRAVRASARQVSSSSRLRDLVSEAAPLHAQDTELTVELINATRYISSSSAASQALQAVFRRRPLPARTAEPVSRAIPSISSSSAQAEALESLFGSRQVEPEVLHAAIDTVQSISSSSAQGEALQAALQRTGLDVESQRQVALASMSISSSSVQGEVLRLLAQTCDLEEDVVLALVEAAGHISSATSRRDVISALLERGPLPPSSRERLRLLIEDLPSSYASKLLSKMLERHSR